MSVNIQPVTATLPIVAQTLGTQYTTAATVTNTITQNTDNTKKTLLTLIANSSGEQTSGNLREMGGGGSLRVTGVPGTAKALVQPPEVAVCLKCKAEGCCRRVIWIGDQAADNHKELFCVSPLYLCKPEVSPLWYPPEDQVHVALGPTPNLWLCCAIIFLSLYLQVLTPSQAEAQFVCVQHCSRFSFYLLATCVVIRTEPLSLL